jgi:hypothetical protein
VLKIIVLATIASFAVGVIIALGVLAAVAGWASRASSKPS